MGAPTGQTNPKPTIEPPPGLVWRIPETNVEEQIDDLEDEAEEEQEEETKIDRCWC